MDEEGKKTELTLIDDGSVVGGVSTGIAKHYDESVVLVRLLMLAIFASDPGIAFIAYTIMWIIIPDDPES